MSFGRAKLAVLVHTGEILAKFLFFTDVKTSKHTYDENQGDEDGGRYQGYQDAMSDFLFCATVGWWGEGNG